MTIPQEFISLPLDRLRDTAHRMKDEGWRFIQTHAVYNDPNVDLYYSFMKDGRIANYRIEGVTKEDPVPSITDIFLAAFVFENEARELFGVDMRDIAIDFQGALYAPAESEPMRVITPEQKAAIDKARKAAAMKAAKAAGETPAASATAHAPAGKPFVMTPEKRARFEAKLEGRTPEQIEKARACLAAKEAGATGSPATKSAPETASTEKSAVEAAAAEVKAEATTAPQVTSAKDDDLESKLAVMDPAKAAKVRAAIAARNGEAAPIKAPEAANETLQTATALDDEAEAKIELLDSEKADKVREAIARRASMKGGE